MDPSAPQEVREDRLKRYRWMHLLGWLFLAAIALIAQWIGPAFFEHLRWLIDWMAPGASLGWKIGLGIVVLLIGPLAAGAIAQFIIQSGQGRSKADALQQMQKKLFSEIEPGDQPGYQVALVDTPNASVRSLGVVTSTFEESATGRRLATVYLPNTPDPTKGAMRVVAMQDISALGWTLDDLTTLHITFGSVTPETCCPPPPYFPLDSPLFRGTRPLVMGGRTTTSDRTSRSTTGPRRHTTTPHTVVRIFPDLLMVPRNRSLSMLG